MSTFVENIPRDLSQQTTIDVLVHNAQYSQFLESKIAAMRLDASRQADLQPSCLVSTIETLLAGPDSPAHQNVSRPRFYREKIDLAVDADDDPGPGHDPPTTDESPSDFPNGRG